MPGFSRHPTARTCTLRMAGETCLQTSVQVEASPTFALTCLQARAGRKSHHKAASTLGAMAACSVEIQVCFPRQLWGSASQCRTLQRLGMNRLRPLVLHLSRGALPVVGSLCGMNDGFFKAAIARAGQPVCFLGLSKLCFVPARGLHRASLAARRAQESPDVRLCSGPATCSGAIGPLVDRLRGDMMQAGGWPQSTAAVARGQPSENCEVAAGDPKWLCTAMSLSCSSLSAAERLLGRELQRSHFATWLATTPRTKPRSCRRAKCAA